VRKWGKLAGTGVRAKLAQTRLRILGPLAALRMAGAGICEGVFWTASGAYLADSADMHTVLPTLAATSLVLETLIGIRNPLVLETLLDQPARPSPAAGPELVTPIAGPAVHDPSWRAPGSRASTA
jgi:hypothetical protein